MSTRARAHPWFVDHQRLEGYAVEVDRHEEAGGVWSKKFSRVLRAKDFPFERLVSTCPHRLVSWRTTIPDGDPGRASGMLVCTDCGMENPKIFGRATFMGIEIIANDALLADERVIT